MAWERRPQGSSCCVVTQSKFTHGAWIIFVLVPLLVVMFRAIKRHYVAMREQVMLGTESVAAERQRDVPQQYKVVVPLSSLNQASLAALRFASVDLPGR